jgi:hypothetical protein
MKPGAGVTNEDDEGETAGVLIATLELEGFSKEAAMTRL